MILDFGGCWITEITCKKLFADLEPKEFVTRGRERREQRRAAEEAAKEAGRETTADSGEKKRQ
jgi:cation-transporting ATPase 13A1